MRVDVDMSELSDLGRILVESAPKQAIAKGRKVTITEGRLVKARAEAAAPRDRPWLASQGIKQKTFSNPEGPSTNVFTVPDPEGRDVGFYVEYGTSKTPPQPFMQPAIVPAEQSYPAAVLAAIDPFDTDTGDDGGSGDA